MRSQPAASASGKCQLSVRGPLALERKPNNVPRRFPGGGDEDTAQPERDLARSGVAYPLYSLQTHSRSTRVRCSARSECRERQEQRRGPEATLAEVCAFSPTGMYNLKGRPRSEDAMRSFSRGIITNEDLSLAKGRERRHNLTRARKRERAHLPRPPPNPSWWHCSTTMSPQSPRVSEQGGTRRCPIST